MAVQTDDAVGSPAGPSSPSSPIPTTSRWPAAGRWRGSPTRARASCCSARRAASAGRPADPRSADGDLGPRARRRAARGRRRPRHRRRHPARSPGRRPALGRRAELHAEIVAAIRRYRPDAVITFGEDGLVLAPRSHRRPRADDHGRALARRRGAAALLRHDAARRDAGDRRRGRGHGAGRRRRTGFWASCPTPSASRAKPPTFVVDVRDWVPRKLAASAATARRWAPAIPFDQTRRGRGASAGSASNSSIARADDPARPLLDRSSSSASQAHTSTGSETRMRIDTLDILRCPYCGGRLELVDVDVPPTRRRRDPRRHPRLPLLHLSGRRRHSGHAPAAGADDARARTSRPGAPIWRGARCSASTTTDDAERFEAAAPSPTVDVPRHRRGARARLRRRLFPLPLLRPDLRRGPRRRAGGGRHRARAAAARAIDICGGSGHLTRSLIDCRRRRRCSPICIFAKVWLARRFTAPGLRAVCCDGNAPLPFARGAFGFAMCSDAFMYIWTKRQFVGEMVRVTRWTAGGDPGAVLISHTHNQLHWSPSHGQPLPPRATAICSRRSSRGSSARPACSRDVVAAVRWISRASTSQATLDADPALTIDRHAGRPRLCRACRSASGGGRAASSGSTRCIRRRLTDDDAAAAEVS